MSLVLLFDSVRLLSIAEHFCSLHPSRRVWQQLASVQHEDNGMAATMAVVATSSSVLVSPLSACDLRWPGYLVLANSRTVELAIESMIWDSVMCSCCVWWWCSGHHNLVSMIIFIIDEKCQNICAFHDFVCTILCSLCMITSDSFLPPWNMSHLSNSLFLLICYETCKQDYFMIVKRLKY
jgi:hypothetical protein